MIKAVIFDLDNTLYDEKLYFLMVFEEFSKVYGIDADLFKNAYDDRFILHSKDIFTDILKKINFYSKDRQNELFEIYKNINCRLKIYEEAHILMDYLNCKNICKAILTNGVVMAQKNKVRALNLEKFTDKIVYAREFGKEFEKPNEKPFLETLKLLGVENKNAIFVGDNPHTDIVGATKAGIKAFRFINGYTSHIEFAYDYNIDNLLEIKNYLEMENR